MRELPILFSAPMVRAILDGRKTQTRRVLKPQPTQDRAYCGGAFISVPKRMLAKGVIDSKTSVEAPYVHVCCPYGQPGDRLWVKERWRPYVAHSCAMNTCDCGDVEIEYRADGEKRFFLDGEINEASPDWSMPKAAERGDVTPLFMPRWASRLTLEVTGVRVERLQAISPQDAVAEGLVQLPASGRFVVNPGEQYFGGASHSPVEVFADLWERINGAGSWDANPWVWVVEFRRAEQVSA